MPHLRRLESDLEQLGKAFNHNSNIFTHGLSIAEMHDTVMKKVFNDMLNGEVVIMESEKTYWTETFNNETRKLELTSEVKKVKIVDYAHYINYFGQCLLIMEFAAWCKSLVTEQPKVINLATEGETQIFGG